MQRRRFLGLVPALPSLASCVSAGSASTRETATWAPPYTLEGIHHVGNATHLIVLGGRAILTDPWLFDPADFVLRHTTPPAALPTGPDILLVTHHHDDHFDRRALSLLDKRTTVVLPVWMAADARALGFTDVRPIAAGDVFDDVRGVRIEAARGRHNVAELVYRLTHGGRSVFFGGDTLLTPEIEAMAAQAPVDLAILPADGGRLLGTPYVMNSAEAVALARRFGVDRDGRGALLTHHESELSSAIYGLIVDAPPVATGDLPPWFTVPTPGQHIPFPWHNR